MTAIDFYATSAWYLDHLAPVIRALGDRAQLYVPNTIQHHARQLGLRNTSGFGAGSRPVVVAASGDLRRVRERYGRTHVALTEHGAGQSYGGDPRSARHPSYAGGARRDASLFLHPGPHPAARDRAAYPAARVEVVGSPRLDQLPRLEPAGEPVVAVSWHWDAQVTQETRSGFYEFRDAVARLARHYKVIGHGHPRMWPAFASFYRRHGIEAVASFAEVCRRASLYVCDNSSTLFEFAATGRPVLVMNPSIYRRHEHHGLRFWPAAGVGVNVDFTPRDLGARFRDAVAVALSDPPEQQAAREAALDLVYAHRTGAAERAATVLIDWASSLARQAA